MLLCHGETRIADLVCSAAMPLEQTTLSTLAVALAVALVLLAIWVAWLQRSHALLRRRLTRLVGDSEGAGLDEVLDRQFRRLAATDLIVAHVGFGQHQSRLRVGGVQTQIAIKLSSGLRPGCMSN